MNKKSLFTKPINCDSLNPEYNFFLGYYLGLIEFCISLTTINVDSSKKVFSSIFESDLPHSNTTLNDIDYSTVFQGKLNEKTTEIYKEMLSLWMEVQNDQIPGKEDKITNILFQEKLNFIHKKLLE